MRLRAVVLLVGLTACLFAHEPISTKLTWSQEISRIVYKRCASCHAASASVPLITYEQARPWAKAIKEEVLSRRMPPWGAVKGYGDLKDDPSLTQDELTRIAEWVEGGAPEGDERYLPPAPMAQGAAMPPRSATVFTRQALLGKGIRLAGIHPLASVAMSKITARKPDGSIEPLLWLRDYKQQWNHTFRFREPLLLPAGTRIVSEPAIPFELSLFPGK